MNFVNFFGVIFAGGVMLFAMLFHNPNPAMMLDPHGGTIVIGGTIACIGIAYSLPRAFSMVKIFFKGLLRTRFQKDLNKQVIMDLMKLAEAYRTNSSNLAKMVEETKDPFMREAMLALMEEIMEPKKLLRVLHARVNTMYERYTEDAKMFMACGKYPPAMGLMGAVTGMIMLLGSLGKPGAEKTVGPSMAVALVATLYGIAFANLFVIPIGEHLQEIAKKLRTKNYIIVEGIRHIQQKQNPVIVAEELNSFLLPSERVDWKTLTKK
jgi:chemotaxis protein MotA